MTNNHHAEAFPLWAEKTESSTEPKRRLQCVQGDRGSSIGHFFLLIGRSLQPSTRQIYQIRAYLRVPDDLKTEISLQQL
jgi:hypothetical protein